ncbi:MAG: pyruvate formate lyase family protein [Clostridiales bacterium]|nr:pyruvate formate lyase family protein [Clostridiales bacterium]
MSLINNVPIHQDECILKPVLPEQIVNLRGKALANPDLPLYGVPVMRLIDAQSWIDYSKSGDDNYQVWRVERLRGRMRRIPINIEFGEMLVGKPLIRQATEDEELQICKIMEFYNKIPDNNDLPPGDFSHYTPDYQKLFTLGISGMRQEISTYRNMVTDNETQSFYDSCDKAMQAMSEYILRVAAECEYLALKSEEFGYLTDTASACRNIASEPPKTFFEAIQLMLLTIIILWFGEDHYLTTPGRMDQTLWPFYRDDIAAGRCTRQCALELTSCLYIQLNRILQSGSAESVMVGGRDKTGEDVTNEMTYICLAARSATHLVYPTVGLAWHENTPDEFMEYACRMICTGIGDPAFFNDETISQGLQELGVSREDSYNYINSTCVEIKVAGSSFIWVAQPYINCPRIFLDTLDKIIDSGDDEPQTIDVFIALLKEQMAVAIKEAAKKCDDVWMKSEQLWGSPLASCFTNDCIVKGIDFAGGGARYSWVENSFVGLANLTDSCMSVKKLVYEDREFTLKQLQQIIKADFKEYEELRQRILQRIAKYGNDNNEVDAIAADWAEFLIKTTEANRVGHHHYVAGFFCWIMHEILGSETGATLDGRKAGFPLADGVGASQGSDRSGPTASVLSTTKWSHKKAIGGLVHNVKFSKKALNSNESIMAVRSLIEVYLKRGGFEIQVNVVGADELLDAQKHPENHADLLVRVAGFSCYFVKLTSKLQEEIIARSEYDLAKDENVK